MRYRLLLLWVCFLTATGNSYGQPPKQVSSLTQTWMSYFNQTRISKRWGVWFDLQLYSRDHMLKWIAQMEARAGAIYYLADDTRLSAGYALIDYFPGDGHAHISQPEHRGWQQLQWYTRYKKFRIMQWLRLEERFVRKVLNDDSLADGYNFNYRVRYNLFFTVPLANNNTPLSKFAFCIGDEVYINFGSHIVNNYFDQNRIFIGGSFKTNAHDNLQAGYLHIFQELAPANSFRKLDIFRVSYFHNVDLRKK